MNATASVTPLSNARSATPAPGPSVVDEWGRDQATVDVLEPFVRLRFHVRSTGLEHLPGEGGALLVSTNRRWSWDPMVAAFEITRRTSRTVRFAGRSDRAPGGAALRRLGGILARPDEVATALDEGDLVMVAAAPSVAQRRAGGVDHRLLAPAIERGLTILPLAVLSSPLRRRVRMAIGEPVRAGSRRRGPLADVERADATRARLDEMLTEVAASMRRGSSWRA